MTLISKEAETPQGDDMVSQGLGQDQCGSRDVAGVEATAPLSTEEHLTETQRRVLLALDRTVNGVTRFHDPHVQEAAISLTHTGLISDVFETVGGAIACRITSAGRAALASHQSGDAT